MLPQKVLHQIKLERMYFTQKNKQAYKQKSKTENLKCKIKWESKILEVFIDKY